MVAFQWVIPCNIWTHGSWVRAFLRFQPCFRHALSHSLCNKFCPKLPKTAKICQNLPKGETLKYHQKSRLWSFSKIKFCTCRRGTRACFYRLDFQSKNVPHLLWIWDFGDMYLTHLETSIWRGSFHIYFKKWFFWSSKLCCPLKAQWKKLCCQLWTLWSCKPWGMSV
jgi:hypothetical protein